MNYKKFPFGKYKGHQISDIPTTYLVYSLEEFSLPDELEGSIKEELSERLCLSVNDNYSNTHVKSVYRMMSKKYHPDYGGDDNVMAAINEFYAHLIND